MTAPEPIKGSLTASERRLDEEELLGALLTAPEYVEDVRRKLRVSDFEDPHLGELYGAILRLPSVTTQSTVEFLTQHQIHPPLGSTWGALLSELIDKAGAISRRSVLNHVETIRRRAFDRRRRNLLLGVGEAGANGDDLSNRLDRFLREGAEIQSEAAATPRIESAFITAEQLFQEEPLPRKPILAGGVFDTGMYGLGYGPDGSGKSIATAHMLVSVAAGVSHFGLGTCGPYPVGYIYTDDDRDEVKKRLASILQREDVDSPETCRRIHILARPFPWGPSIDLTDREAIRGVVGYLKDNGIRLFAIDHIAACHHLPAYDYMPLILAADRIAQEADCGVLLIAHPSKAASRVGPDEPGADDIYGDSRLRNFARLRIRFSKSESNGLFRMKFEKVSRGAAPPDIWLAQDPPETGDPSFYRTQLTTKAKTAKRERIARIAEVLADAPGREMSAAQLARDLGVGERALRKYPVPQGVLRDQGMYSLKEVADVEL